MHRRWRSRCVGAVTPTTILQKCAGTRRVRSGRRRIDAQDDVDLFAIDLDALHQKADQLAALMPVQVRHPVVHATGELFQSAKDGNCSGQ
jgi:hypothetical protein